MQLVRELKASGHYIIITTSRLMQVCGAMAPSTGLQVPPALFGATGTGPSSSDALSILTSSARTRVRLPARPTQECGGNVGAVVAACGNVTLRTLEALQIPYDEIHFGQPFAHVYVITLPSM